MNRALNLHGDAFYLWANYYKPGDQIRQIDEEFFNPTEDVLVFWTEEEPTVPALALAEKDWMTVSTLSAAINRIPAKVGLILDSCSSNLWFNAMQEQVSTNTSVDFVLTSAGGEQASLYDQSLQTPLFALQLSSALNLPNVKTFGEAVSYARMTTVLHATAICSTMIVPAKDYDIMFPSRPAPTMRTHDGQVSPPLWYCAQVPSVADFSGDLSSRVLYKSEQ